MKTSDPTIQTYRKTKNYKSAPEESEINVSDFTVRKNFFIIKIKKFLPKLLLLKNCESRI